MSNVVEWKLGDQVSDSDSDSDDNVWKRFRIKKQNPTPRRKTIKSLNAPLNFKTPEGIRDAREQFKTWQGDDQWEDSFDDDPLDDYSELDVTEKKKIRTDDDLESIVETLEKLNGMDDMDITDNDEFDAMNDGWTDTPQANTDSKINVDPKQDVKSFDHPMDKVEDPLEQFAGIFTLKEGVEYDIHFLKILKQFRKPNEKKEEKNDPVEQEWRHKENQIKVLEKQLEEKDIMIEKLKQYIVKIRAIRRSSKTNFKLKDLSRCIKKMEIAAQLETPRRKLRPKKKKQTSTYKDPVQERTKRAERLYRNIQKRKKHAIIRSNIISKYMAKYAKKLSKDEDIIGYIHIRLQTWGRCYLMRNRYLRKRNSIILVQRQIRNILNSYRQG